MMTIPAQTFAVEITEAGKAEVLKATQRLLPPLAKGQVLIKVATAFSR